MSGSDRAPTVPDGARYAVIGHPVEHSLSPLIHRHFAAAHDQILSYDLLPAAESAFAAEAQAFFTGAALKGPASGATDTADTADPSAEPIHEDPSGAGHGLNVTLPFKEQARQFVDWCDPAAELAGAVNTIRKSASGRLEGFNTDGLGLLRDLQDNLGWTLAGARVLLIGAGGASRGALDALLNAGPETLVLANRTLSRAQSLVNDVAPGDARIELCAPAQVEGSFDLVINATSASIAGQGALVPTDAVRGAHCYDMLYAPTQTVFAGWALSHGARAVADGLGMLLEQAAEAFLIWRGVRPKTDDLLQQRAALFAAKQAQAASLTAFLASLETQEAPRPVHPPAQNAPKRRFIAGAVCPQCREVDRIVIRETAEGREQACIACGYSQPETQGAGAGATATGPGMVPRGKHERPPQPKDGADQVQTVRLIDPKKMD